ncbi:hypothetical protein [Thermopolyspora flexuosa]|uniref:Parallel beta helix pectate lyase-like protein n=1 Tax=Thermopolyspora flexuosa TaxID=103836 RepID=A0A543J3A3_9ACTN|nr:hypothetical protein [Thermopolyspora flexuosa]TQM77303.1 hypothetical protein FHX40_4065 [Thermopolyspora flexuosa]
MSPGHRHGDGGGEPWAGVRRSRHRRQPGTWLVVGLVAAALAGVVLAALLITGTSPAAHRDAGPYAAVTSPPGPGDASPTPAEPVPSREETATEAAETPAATPASVTSTEQPVPPTPAPSRRKCPGHPTPACTGVPPGTRLTTLPLNVDGAAYEVTEPGTVLDGVHIPGDLLIRADGVVIRNSRIDGGVSNEYRLRRYSFTITDSTVGPATGCLTAPGIGEARFTALRVHVRGHGDGFHASGDDIVIRDSYVKLCSNPGDHSDGIQTYKTGKGLIFDHNTVDQRYAKDITAPIFITDEGAEDVIVTRNLVMGGTYSIQVKNVSGRAVVRDNRLVDGSWVYGPVEADCATIEWSGNTLVTIDEDYRITRTVGPLHCAT